MEMEGEAEVEMGEEGGSNRHGDGGVGGWRAASFFFFSVLLVRILLFFCLADLGGRRVVIPHYDCAGWSEVGKRLT